MLRLIRPLLFCFILQTSMPLPVQAQCDSITAFIYKIDNIIIKKNYADSLTAYYFSISLFCGFGTGTTSAKAIFQRKLEHLLKDMTDSFRILHAQAKADNETYKTNIEEKDKTLEKNQIALSESDKKVIESNEHEQIVQKQVVQVQKKFHIEKSYAQALKTAHNEDANAVEKLEAVIAIGDRTQEGLNTVSPESDSTADYYKDLSYVFYKLFSSQDSLNFINEVQKKYFLIPDDVEFKYPISNPPIWNNPNGTVKRVDMHLNKPRLLEDYRFPTDAQGIINIGTKKIDIHFIGGSTFATITSDSLVDTLRHQLSITSVNILPKNGSYYALTTSKDSTAKLWIKKQAIVLKHHNVINFARFSPNGKYIVTCSDDKTAKLWDVKRLVKYTESEKALIATFPHSNPVIYCMFDDESKYLLTNDKARLLRVWILPEQIMALIKEKHLIDR